MKRFKDAPTDERCQAVVTLADGTTADCGRRCTQHAKMEIARLLAVNASLLAACKAVASVQTLPGEVCPRGFLRARDLCDAEIAKAEGGGE